MSIVETIRASSNYRFAKELCLRLKSYLQKVADSGNSTLIPEGTSSISISNLTKIGGGLWNDVYSMTLVYSENDVMQTRNLVLKTYRNEKDPYDLIRKNFAYKVVVAKYMREFQLLKNLNFIGFPVPNVIACEPDSRFLGYPFIIMQKEDVVKKNITDFVDCFATTLANLHNLQIEGLAIDFLRTPNDKNEFAKSWPVHYKQYLNLEPKHSKRLKEEFISAVHWLDSNSTKKNSCPRYCLVHGDYHPGNVCVTRDSRLVVLDWDSIEIGDPALDVGYAYHFVKFFSNPRNPNSSEPIAKRFVSKYAKTYEGDISGRLDFYKMVGILGASIFCSSGLSNPIYAYKHHHRKVLPSFPSLSGLFILLGFPFIRQPFVARQLGTEGDIYWLQYFEDFLETTLKG